MEAMWHSQEPGSSEGAVVVRRTGLWTVVFLLVKNVSSVFAPESCVWYVETYPAGVEVIVELLKIQ